MLVIKPQNKESQVSLGCTENDIDHTEGHPTFYCAHMKKPEEKNSQKELPLEISVVGRGNRKGGKLLAMYFKLILRIDIIKC